MDRFLLSIKYPHTIKRHPVDIESTGKWKATQLHVFLLYIALPFSVHYYIPQPHRCQPSAQTFTQPPTPIPAAVLKSNLKFDKLSNINIFYIIGSFVANCSQKKRKCPAEEDVLTDIDIRGAIDKINLRLELLENNVK